MALSPYVGPLAWAVGDGTALAASAAQTSLLLGTAASGKWPMPGGYFIAPGQMVRIKASGRVSTPAATQGNLSFQVVIGAVNVAASQVFTTLASQTNLTWILDWQLTLRAVGDGTLANFMHTGSFLCQLISLTNETNIIPATAPAVGTGFNSSAAATLDFQALWSNATAGNTIQLHQYALESLV
jgi:hypothetical protein